MKNEKQENPYEGTTFTKALSKALTDVDSGETFKCDLFSHNLQVGGFQVVKDGKFVGNPDSKMLTHSDPLSEIEREYALYKRSVPSERSNRKKYRGVQFKALDFSELEDDDILYGDRRELAQARLEITVLFLILSGELTWNETWGTWFWKSEKDPDLVLLKQWFTPNTTKEN